MQVARHEYGIVPPGGSAISVGIERRIANVHQTDNQED
jgi:hypothetical protein